MRALLLALPVLLAAGGCQRAGSEESPPEADVALRVDGVAIDPVHLRRGQTVVVAGNGHGDPAWVSARGRGTDGRFVTAALARYPHGELRLVWGAGEAAPTLAFHESKGESARRLSEARGVSVIDLMTLKGATSRPAPEAPAGVVLVTAAGEKTVTAEELEALEASSIPTGQRRGAQLVDLLARHQVDTWCVQTVVLHQRTGDPVRVAGAALRTQGEAVVLRYNKRGELRVFHQRGGNTAADARGVTRIQLLE